MCLWGGGAGLGTCGVSTACALCIQCACAVYARCKKGAWGMSGEGRAAGEGSADGDSAGGGCAGGLGRGGAGESKKVRHARCVNSAHCYVHNACSRSAGRGRRGGAEGGEGGGEQAAWRRGEVKRKRSEQGRAFTIRDKCAQYLTSAVCKFDSCAVQVRCKRGARAVGAGWRERGDRGAGEVVGNREGEGARGLCGVCEKYW